MAYKQEVWRGFGYVFINGRNVGNVELVTAGITTANFKVKDYRTGKGNVIDDNSIENVEFAATLLDSSPANLALGVFGTLTSSEVLAFTDLVVAGEADRLIELPRMATIATVKIEDGASYRAAVEGVDYEMNIAGVIALADANFKLTGEYDAVDTIEALTEKFPVVSIACTMTSDFEPGVLYNVKFHRVSLAPLASLNLLGDSATKIELKGAVLSDATKPAGKSQFFIVSKKKVAV